MGCSTMPDPDSRGGQWCRAMVRTMDGARRECGLAQHDDPDHVDPYTGTRFRITHGRTTDAE